MKSMFTIAAICGMIGIAWVSWVIYIGPRNDDYKSVKNLVRDIGSWQFTGTIIDGLADGNTNIGDVVSVRGRVAHVVDKGGLPVVKLEHQIFFQVFF